MVRSKVRTSAEVTSSGLEVKEVGGELGQLGVQQVSEDGHVDRQSSQVVGKVALRQHLVYQQDHHLNHNPHSYACSRIIS